MKFTGMPVMNRPLAAGAALLLAVTAPAQKEDLQYRVFRNAEGAEISAAVVEKTDKDVLFLLENGKRARVAIDKLSEEDKEFVRNWSEAEAKFLLKCRGLTVRELLELRGYESFPFTLERNSILVEGMLNGKKGSFLIDTGAGTSVLHVKYATGAGCKVGRMGEETIYGIAGDAPAAWAEVAELKMGEAVLRQRRILATDLTNGLPGGVRAGQDAIFGADFLHQLDAVISYKERRIFLRPDLSDETELDDIDHDPDGRSEKLTFRLFKLKDGKTLRGRVKSKTSTGVTLTLVDGSDRSFSVARFSDEDQTYIFQWSKEAAIFMQHCRSLSVEKMLTLRSYQSFQYERRGNHIFVDGTLNKNPVTYMIDTGAESSVLHVWAANKHNCRVGPMDREVFGIGGKAPAAVTEIDELTMGDAVLTNRKVLSVDLARFMDDDKLGYVGIFGADFMRELDAVITYRESRVFLRQQ